MTNRHPDPSYGMPLRAGQAVALGLYDGTCGIEFEMDPLAAFQTQWLAEVSAK